MPYRCCLVFLTLISVSLQYLCPDFCECEDSIVECICGESSETISLRIRLPDEARELHVNNCSKVDISMAGLSFRSYEKIELLNIGNLNIQRFSFTGVRVNSHFKMENISNLKVSANGFNGLTNLASLEIRSVKADVIKDFAFGGLQDIGSVVISNCVFHELESQAFHLKNLTSFRIENSFIGEVANISFELIDVEEIVINKTVINVVETEGFRVSTVGYLEFQGCEFGSLASRAFVTENVTEVAFVNCGISESKRDAFLLVKPKQQLIFTGNEIGKAWKDSILPNTGVVNKNGVLLKVDNNGFRCDCDIAWMWDKQNVYKEILATSYCIDVQNVTLSLLTPIFDDDGNCTELEFVSNNFDYSTDSSAEKLFSSIAILFFLKVLLIWNSIGQACY